MHNHILEDVDLLEAVEVYSEIETLEESSFLSKQFLQTKVTAYNKKKGVSIKSMPDLIKNHSNPGLTELVKNSKDIDELKYLKKDTQTTFSTLNKIKERIGLCKRLGETDKTKNYYKAIKRDYIDKGLTEKDVDATIVGMKKLIEDINKRIKELEKK